MMSRILFLFLFMSVALISCKKKEYQLGSDLIDQNSLLEGTSVDTFDILSYSIIEDSIISDNASNVLLGSYNDPLFGAFSSSFYTQLRLASVDPNFADPSTIVIDSFVIGLEYLGYYGELDDQSFEVYQLDESLSIDSTYYSFNTLSHNGVNLVPAEHAVITPKPLDPTVIGEDSLDELEIKDGKAEELREIAKQMVAFNDEGEPETLVYDVYISEDEKLLTFWETHANSDALLFHADRFATGQFVGEVLERTERTRLCLYGNITAEIRKWALDNGFENEYHASIDGFQRV